METNKESGLLHVLEKNKAAILVLLLGILLLALPSGKSNDVHTPGDSAEFDTEEEKLCAVLEQIEGSGRVYVLLRQDREGFGGAVVVCDGADSASVSLEIVRAVAAYTGLGSNRIIVLKMKNQGGN